MVKKMLIDAAHPEEIRVAVVTNNTLEDFDSETITKRQLKGNIYLAKVIRVEPALQAAFVDFGGERHGFLPFAEIHPDYYRIPVDDRPADSDTDQESQNDIIKVDQNNVSPDSDEIIDTIDTPKIDKKHRYRYKIQEVIKRKQLMLVQVVKEERGGKGAALTTYVSIPGRYSVLMPNAGNRGGGVSKKIYDGEDRKRLRQVLKDLEVPEGMSLIVRTAGHERTKLEIRRDYEYLCKLWEEIRGKTITSNAPVLIYAEGDLIKRAIRDIYTKDIEQILVDGEDAYRQAKSFMRSLMPSHTKKVQQYKDSHVPLFYHYKVDEHIDKIMLPKVNLPSGGYLVINMTEALVAIDVNSGRAIKERSIDSTALKTNLEAAQEAARQIRLRDLAGLIVVDFIDMEENNHINQVERKFKEALKADRARVQVGRISQFGLMELSRQRLRPSLLETHTKVCVYCNGTGVIRSIESMALHVLRAIEKEAFNGHGKEIIVTVADGVDSYLLNQKRHIIVGLEQKFAVKILINRDNAIYNNDYRVDTLEKKVEIKKPTENEKILDSQDTPIKEHKKPNENKATHTALPKNIVRPQTVQAVEAQINNDENSNKQNVEKKHHRYKRHHRRKRFNNNESQSQTVNTPVNANIEEAVDNQTKPLDNQTKPLENQKHKRYSARRKHFKNHQTQPEQIQEKTSQKAVDNRDEVITNKKSSQKNHKDESETINTEKRNTERGKTESKKSKETIDLPVINKEKALEEKPITHKKNSKKNWIQRLLD